MTTLPNGMFPTLADTLGLTMTCNVQSQTVERLSAELAVARNERDDAIEQAVAAHELIDIQREQIQDYQHQIDAMRVQLREMEPLARKAGELAQALDDEGKFCDYFRDEALMCAAHLAEIDDLLTRVGIADDPTIERVNSVISLWLAAEARAQGLANGDDAGADSRR
jgi:hypothetical protein